MGEFTFKLPDVGEGTAEAEIVAWHVAVGDHIEEDQPLVDVMTDKATVEMTTPVSGVVTAIHGEPGDMAAVGSALAVIATDAAAPDLVTPHSPAAKPPSPAAVSASAPRADRPLDLNRRSGGNYSKIFIPPDALQPAKKPSPAVQLA